MRAATLAGLTAVLAGGCQVPELSAPEPAPDAGAGGAGRDSAACEAGATRGCACVEGGTGRETCRPDSTGYGRCVCVGDGGGGGGGGGTEGEGDGGGRPGEGEGEPAEGEGEPGEGEKEPAEGEEEPAEGQGEGGCRTEDDCGASEVCVDSECRPDEEPEDPPIEHDCATNQDCGPGRFCDAGRCRPQEEDGPEGESCADPIPMRLGDTVEGQVGGQLDDLVGCGPAGSADVVYRVEIVEGEALAVFIETRGTDPGVAIGIWDDTCGAGRMACLPPDFRGGGDGPPRPGAYFLVIEGEGRYRISFPYIAVDGSCVPGDEDGDGSLACDGDCDDGDPAVHPGAPELCQGLDDDCDGRVDESTGPCDTGRPGICNSGVSRCDGGRNVCAALVEPQAEICGDRRDNDCDGSSDEAMCAAVAPGADCVSAIRLFPGQRASGSLEGAPPGVPPRCSERHEGDPNRRAPATLAYTFDVPPELFPNGAETTLWANGSHPAVAVALYRDNCGPEGLNACIGSSGPAWTGWLEPGRWNLVVEAGPVPLDDEPRRYSIVVAMRGPDGACQVGDRDGDGATLCDGDCDEDDVLRGPHVAERCGDDQDSDCSGDPHDARGPCDTGLRGICAAGERRCRGDREVCEPHRRPGPEICGDQTDNDCDGNIDEQDCGHRDAGETCELARDIGVGGTFLGDLSRAFDDAPPECAGQGGLDGRGPAPGSGGEHYYRFELDRPSLMSLSLVGSDRGVVATVLRGRCGEAGRSDDRECHEIYGMLRTMLEPGVWQVVVERRHGEDPAGGRYELNVAFGGAEGEACSVSDRDVDGYTICEGDCREANPSFSPAARERCDSHDNNCDWGVDDLHASCAVQGGRGICATGQAFCDGLVEACDAVVRPGPEWCADMLDNDCDGSVDEGGCWNPPAGENCATAIALVLGQWVVGNLSQASNDVFPGCHGRGAAEHVYFVDVPDNAGEGADLTIELTSRVGDVSYFTSSGICVGAEEHRTCVWGEEVRNEWHPPGRLYVVVEQAPWEPGPEGDLRDAGMYSIAVHGPE